MKEGMTTILETERLILRPWKDEDAPQLYELCKDPDIGPRAGWPPHKDVQESLEIIRTTLNDPLTFAICLKGEPEPLGAISLMETHLENPEKQKAKEMGFWIGKPYWGNGYVVEAGNRLIDYGFEKLNLDAVWCAHYVGNEKSKRAQEKLGYTFFAERKNVPVPLLGEIRDLIENHMTRKQWESLRAEK
ncbi:GNAT family N-acetyltransferase [Allobaculum mucilyticum]|uniref:GNAT family N-acetyltransferase n=2 Tax=Allobaculum mucilyticum TaxID=2834459 RepID=UPI001F60B8BE|nr:GNAT family N-acetyltransferase [Allobaculum mucilyticum]UNT96560.1 GNAT family N-acetyltransferase [Allobaculum mucilyticum]